MQIYWVSKFQDIKNIATPRPRGQANIFNILITNQILINEAPWRFLRSKICSADLINIKRKIIQVNE